MIRTRAASSCSGSMRRRTSWQRASPWRRGFDLVKGFAVGRTIFGDVARSWLAAAMMGDEDAVATMARALSRACATIWDQARAQAREERGA